MHCRLDREGLKTIPAAVPTPAGEGRHPSCFAEGSLAAGAGVLGLWQGESGEVCIFRGDEQGYGAGEEGGGLFEGQLVGAGFGERGRRIGAGGLAADEAEVGEVASSLEWEGSGWGCRWGNRG